MDMEKKDVRVTLLMSPADIDALDAWRADRRIWSRSEAIRSLIILGMAAPNDSASPKPRK